MKSLLNKATKNTSFFSVLGVLVYKASQLTYQIALARFLSGPDYAHFFFMYAAVIGLSSFLGEGFGISLSRFLSLNLNDQHKTQNLPVAGIAAGLSICIAIAISVIHSILYKNEYPVNLCWLVAITALYAGTITSTTLLQYMTLTLGKTKTLAKTQILSAILTILVSIPAALIYGWTGAILSWSLCLLAGNIFLYTNILTQRETTSLRPRYNHLKEIFSDALPICGAMALNGPVHVYCLSTLQAYASSKIEISLFGVSYIFYTLMSFLPNALGQIILQAFLKRDSSSDNNFITMRKLYLIGGIPFLFITLISIYLLSGYFSQTIYERSLSAMILTGAGYLAGLVAIYIHFMNAKGQSKLVLISSFIFSATYITLTFSLVSRMGQGSEGLAAALFGGFLSQLSALILFKEYQKKAGAGF